MKTAGDADFYSYDPYAYNDKPDSGLMAEQLRTVRIRTAL